MSSNFSLYNGADPWAGTDWYRPAPNPTMAYAEQAAQPPPQFDPYEPMPTYQPGPQRPLGTLEALAASGNRGILGRIGAIRLAKRRQQEQQQEEAYRRQFLEWKARREDAEGQRRDKAQERDDYVLVDTVDANGKHVRKFVKKGEPGEFPAPPKEYAPRDLDTQEEKLERLREQERIREDMLRLGAQLRPGRQEPEPPTSIQEYNFDVKQGFKGTRQEWEKQRAENNRKPEEDETREWIDKETEKLATDTNKDGTIGSDEVRAARAEAGRKALALGKKIKPKKDGKKPAPFGVGRPLSSAPKTSNITHTTKDNKFGWNGKEWVALQ